ncbi:hypothetical protein KKG66_09685 [bacterium]|nr:hypothetical protein [bacterium]MBU1921107.1 hypothetical protein [bacterium]
MKWFKHDTDGHESEKLVALRSKFGWDWLARWYVLLEMVAAKMDDSDRCHLEYPIKEWCYQLDCTPRQLLAFMTYLDAEKIGGSTVKVDPELLQSFTQSSPEVTPKLRQSSAEVSPRLRRDSVAITSKLLRIDIPNLLKKRDDSSRKVRKKSSKSPGQSVERRNSSNEELKERRAKSEEHANDSEPNIAPSPFPKPESEDQFLNDLDEFMDQLNEIVKLTEHDRRGIRFDILQRGKSDDLSWILDQLRAAKTDGRLNVEKHGIRNATAFIRSKIQELSGNKPQGP